MLKIYVCSPYRGDVDTNTERARRYCREVLDAGYIPVAPHLYYPQFLGDDDPVEREIGIQLGLHAMHDCFEVWVYGEPTEGMKKEIEYAESCRIPVIIKMRGLKIEQVLKML